MMDSGRPHSPSRFAFPVVKTNHFTMRVVSQSNRIRQVYSISQDKTNARKIMVSTQVGLLGSFIYLTSTVHYGLRLGYGRHRARIDS